MAWAFVGVSNVVEVTGTAHALVTTGISGLASGDLLIACISSRIASTTSVTLPTTNASATWALVSEQKNNNIATNTTATPSGLMAYCVLTGVSPNLTFTHPVAPSVAIGRLIAYRNVHAISPKDTQGSATTGTNVTLVSVTGLTTTQDEDLIVAMAAGGQEAAWSAFNATSPAGASSTASQVGAPTTSWLERADTNTTTGADTSLAIFDAVKTTAGATGNFTATASQGAAHVIVAGAFRPPTLGTAAGTSATTTATGNALFPADGSAAGTSATTAATGFGVSSGDGSAAATGAASGDGVAVVAAVGSAAGVGTASHTPPEARYGFLDYWFNGLPYPAIYSGGTGGLTYWFNGLPLPALIMQVAAVESGAGTAAGVGAASAEGASLVAGQGTGEAFGETSAAGASLTAAVGTGSAVGATDASGVTLATAAGTGAATSDATAVGVAAVTVAGDGAAAGTGTASGVGAQTDAANGAASGIGTALAVGEQTDASTGTASGIGTASADSTATTASAGTASGIGAAIAVSLEGAARGNAAGTGEAAAIGAAIAASVGNAAGTGIATGRSAGEVRPPISGGIGFLFRPAVAAIEGVAYAALPQFVGYTSGSVGIAGKAQVVLRAFSARSAGEGFAARILPDLVGRGAGVIGASGKAISTDLLITASAYASAGLSGETKAVLPICKGVAMGDHDPDEQTIIALMMAA